MSSIGYEVCGPTVVGEVIDGEAVIMNLRSGVYYSTVGLGASVWQAVEDGAGREDILQWVGAAYVGRPALAEVGEFLDELVERELIRPAGASAATPSLPALVDPYSTPSLSVHEDMQDLIQLDPIHDVAEVGWPVRKIDA